ncbi:MAG: tRNA pseudouridine(38-40) synthase TruA, partial [Flavobacteriia bacterium]|nr:tRNA pseudouridine(38-40) synthase TruA [Flavobacteriia bacterium]
MTRYFFEISYKGKNYHGWQRQANSVSVQETIESCFSKLYSNK